MASATKDGAKGWKVRFYDGNKQRKQIRLGSVNQLTAHNIARHVGALNTAKVSNDRHIPGETARWLAKIGESLYTKLAAVGLVEERAKSKLGPFLADYIAGRVDAKDSTRKKLESARVHLVAFFGENRELRSINAGHSDDFRQFLYKQGHAENTVRRYCGIAKQFFRVALRKRLIDENPFSDQVAAVRGNAEKFHFVTLADSAKILKHCPDVQWKMIFALCRFGGLRCPSEVLALTWEDISWTEKRFTVRSPKTEHHDGKGSRVVPLFPELAEILDEGYRLAFEALQLSEGENTQKTVSGPVVSRYRDSAQNLRTTFQKIVKRAGLKPWPKLFQNLRSTRETELAEEFPLQAVTSWIGNSRLVAAQHYLQLRDEHFSRAAAERSAVDPQVDPKTGEDGQMSETEIKTAREKSSISAGFQDRSAVFDSQKWAIQDSNL